MSIYSAFVDELKKIGKAWEPGQQGPISAELPKEMPKKKQPVIAIHGPMGGVQFTKDQAKAMAANRAGKRVIWGG
jgi:hypothetical protein